MAEPIIRSFASGADFVATLEREEREAASAMQPWQRELEPGDRIAYAYQCAGGEEITIYFEILTPEQRLKATRMWGRGFSIHCVEGELGSMWRCNALVQVNPVAWEMARCRGWPWIDFGLLGFERSLSGLRRVQPLAPKRSTRKLCEECGIFPADLPSRLCPGCEAYQEHQR